VSSRRSAAVAASAGLDVHHPVTAANKKPAKNPGRFNPAGCRRPHAAVGVGDGHLSTRRVVVAALLVVGTAGLVVLRAGVLGVSAVTRFDVRVRAAANSHRELPLLGRVVARALAELGQRGLTVTVVVVLAVRRSDSWRPGLVSAGALGLLGVLGQVLKFEVGRLAPRAARVAVHAGGLSWPSGHAANTVVSGALVLWLLPQVRPTLAVWARRVGGALYSLAIAGGGVALVVLDYHWAGDVVGGWLLGGVVLAVVALLATARDGPRRRSGSGAGRVVI